MQESRRLAELKKVSFHYPLPEGGRRSALTEVSLEVREGEVLTVLGAEAAGKTTLASLLAGVFRPTAGEMERSAVLTRRDGPYLAVGLVSQNPEDTFTSPVVREEMGLVLQNLEWEDRKIDRAVEAMLAEIGLSDHADSPPSILSGGQKQLLALASILISDPLLLLLDEPLSLLDHRGRKEVSALISRRAKKTGRTMVYLSSEVEDALRGERTIVLSEGRIVWEGTSDKLPLAEEELAAWGLVTPDLTLLAGLLFPGGGPAGRGLQRPGDLAELLCRFV